MQRPGSTQELKERCHRIRDTLRFRALAGGLVTETEIEQYWPGGEENPTRDRWGWIFCFASMTRMSDRLRDLNKVESKTAAEDDAAIIDALTDQPADLTITRPDGSAMAVSVYPKSHRALEWFRARSKRIAWLVAKRDELEKISDMSVLPLMERVGEEVAFQYALLANAATTSGPWLPWEPSDVPTTCPEWATLVSPGDLLRIWNAFVEVNAIRLAIVQRRLSPSGNAGDKPLSWAEFFSLRSSDTGVATSTLLRDRSLVSELASALKASDVRARTAP